MMYICIAIIAGSILLDQITKWLAVAFLSGGETVYVIPRVLRFHYIENPGAAFGMLSSHRWVFMVISVLAIGAMVFYIVKFKPKSRLLLVSLSMMIGGGIGNMIDRTFLGYVVDFIDFCAFPKLWTWTFNVADSFACVGAGLIMFYLVKECVKDIKKEKNAAKTSSDETTSPGISEESSEPPSEDEKEQ